MEKINTKNSDESLEISEAQKNIDNVQNNYKTKINNIINPEYDESQHLQIENDLALEFWLDKQKIQRLNESFRQPISLSDWVFDSDDEELLFSA